MLDCINIETPFGRMIGKYFDLRSGVPTLIVDSVKGEFFVSGIGVTVSLLLADYRGGKGYVARKIDGGPKQAMQFHPACKPEVRRTVRRQIIAAVNEWALTDHNAFLAHRAAIAENAA